MATKKKLSAQDKLIKKLLGDRPPEPEPRSLSGELGELMPILGQLGEKQSGQYLEDQQKLLEQQYNFFKQHAQEFQGYMMLSNPALMRSQARIEQLGSQMQALERNQYHAPGRALTTEMVQQARQQVRQGGPTTPFTAELDRRALAELKLGGALSAEEERAVQQSAREAWTARGQVGGTPSAIGEVLDRESFARQRMREREAIAGVREAQNLARRGMGQQYGMQAQAASLGRQQAEQQFALQRGQMDLAVGDWNRQTTYTPLLLGATQNVQTPSSGAIMGAGLQYGSDLFNTNLNMAADIFNSYQNNAAALMGAQMQAQQVGAAGAAAGRGAMAGGLMGAGGAIGGALIGAAPALIAF